MKENILNFYGLKRMPFGKDIASVDLFQTRALEDSLAMIQLGMEDEDLLLLTGSIGCGKSVILRACMAAVDQNRYLPIYLRGNSMTQADLYRLILIELKVDPPRYLAKARLLFYATMTDLSRKPLVFIDDAQDVGQDALLSLKAMVNFNQDSRSFITVVLAGQPELRTLLAYSHFQALRQRIKLSIHLSGMDLAETCAYIAHNLKVAGRPSPLFSDSAMIEIFKRSGGLARQINALCYQSIVNGAIARREIIDTHDVPETVN
jgi:type II secretory pathway predicted ATPase ExeA